MRPYFTAVAGSWIVLCAVALFYSREHHSLHWIQTAALPAFMVETLFYLGSVLESSRSWFASVRGTRTKAALLWVSALIPFLIFSIEAGTFSRNAFYVLALLSGILAFWHAVLPRRPAYDVGFLVIAAAPFITKVFARIYLSPAAHTKMDILGHLMWIRVGLLGLLILREWNPGPIGLWPRGREWRIGAIWFALAIVPLSLVALGLHNVRFEPITGPWWRIAGATIGIFFGAFWVVALAEELFFRGVVECACLDAGLHPAIAVGLSALLYGCAHLWVHHFPNWQRSTVVVILGIACGIAYDQTGTIRASMVTHAMTITVWKVFFKDF